MKQRNTPQAPMKKGKASLVLGIISAILLALTAVGIWLMREYLSDPELVREKIGGPTALDTYLLRQTQSDYQVQQFER